MRDMWSDAAIHLSFPRSYHKYRSGEVSHSGRSESFIHPLIVLTPLVTMAWILDIYRNVAPSPNSVTRRMGSAPFVNFLFLCLNGHGSEEENGMVIGGIGKLMIGEGLSSKKQTCRSINPRMKRCITMHTSLLNSRVCTLSESLTWRSKRASCTTNYRGYGQARYTCSPLSFHQRHQTGSEMPRLDWS